MTKFRTKLACILLTSEFNKPTTKLSIEEDPSVIGVDDEVQYLNHDEVKTPFNSRKVSGAEMDAKSNGSGQSVYGSGITNDSATENCNLEGSKPSVSKRKRDPVVGDNASDLLVVIDETRKDLDAAFQDADDNKLMKQSVSKLALYYYIIMHSYPLTNIMLYSLQDDEFWTEEFEELYTKVGIQGATKGDESNVVQRHKPSCGVATKVVTNEERVLMVCDFIMSIRDPVQLE
jgi:hypothetical protein